MSATKLDIHCSNWNCTHTHLFHSLAIKMFFISQHYTFSFKYGDLVLFLYWADFRNLPWFSLASAFPFPQQHWLALCLCCCWANLLQPGAKLALFGTFPAPLPPPGNLLSVNGETFWSQTQQQREATIAMCDHGQLDHGSSSTAHLHMWKPFEDKKKIEVATIDQ